MRDRSTLPRNLNPLLVKVRASQPGESGNCFIGLPCTSFLKRRLSAFIDQGEK